jgi:hypothetical protein
MRIEHIAALYDQAHEPEIAGLSWSLTNGSLRHYDWCPIRRKTVNAFSLAELVWRLAHGETIKRFRHLNGNRLDCRLANLQPASTETVVQRSRRPCSVSTPSPRPTPKGGKHAAPATEGDIHRTAEQIFREWHGLWDASMA